MKNENPVHQATGRADPPAIPTDRIAVLLSFSGKGGVEKMVLNLIRALDALGVSVDLLAIRASGIEGVTLPPSVRLVDLGVGHTSLAVLPLALYLRRHRPVAVLAAKDRAIRAMVRARALARVDCRVVGRLGTNLSAALAHKPRWMQRLRLDPMRSIYRKVDHVVCVSAGVLADTHAITGLDAHRLSVIRNPVVTPELESLARQRPAHPWYEDGGVPVVIGVGRLTAQKDFATLIRAFAILTQKMDARLVILGEGREREDLQRLVADSGLSAKVSLPGFDSNPYPWIAHARLFALSSAWEGSPNVLTEAMALGVACVATDCPSGPREILDHGRLGELVPVGDAVRLARAMHAALLNPVPAQALREATSTYRSDIAARAYLAVLHDRSDVPDALGAS